MACSYCYVDKRYSNQMSDKVLRILIERAFELPNRSLIFIWHGGEPLLAGLDFYEKVVSYQNELQDHGDPRHIQNLIQTNGTLITADWCNFFYKHDFNVAISLDGPSFLHDKQRPFRDGTSSLHMILNNVNIMRSYNQNPCVITVLEEESLYYPKEMVDFYIENGFTHVTYNLNFKYFIENNKVITKRYDAFLKDTFEYINKHALPLRVRQFEWALDSITQRTHSIPVCFHSQLPCIYCSSGIDAFGNIYPGCTKLMEVHEDEKPAFAIGNITDVGLLDARNSIRFREIEQTINTHRLICAATCESFKHCYGGCTAQLILERKESSQRCYCTSVRSLLNLMEQFSWTNE